MRSNALRRAIVGIAVGAFTVAGVSAGVTTAGAASSTPKAKVMVIGNFTAGSFGFGVPETVASAKAALKNSNVEIESCDSKNDAAAGEACANKAVRDGVVAVVEGFATGGDDILKQAGIPVLGNTSTTNPNSFPVTNIQALYAANGVALAKAGCKKVGLLQLDGPALTRSTVQGAGPKAPRSWPRLASFECPMFTAIAKIIDAGAQCVSLSVIRTGLAGRLRDPSDRQEVADGRGE